MGVYAAEGPISPNLNSRHSAMLPTA